MGNCLQILNRKHLHHSIHKEYNQMSDNDSLNYTKSVLCNTDYHNGDCTHSIFNESTLKEFNDQYTLTNYHKTNNIQYEYKHSLDYNNSYPILNEDCIINLEYNSLLPLKWNSMIFNKNNSFIHNNKLTKDKKLYQSNLTTTDRFNQNIRKNSYRLTPTTNINEINNLETLYKINCPSLINSSLLGFTILKSNQFDCIEWLHNDNIIYSNVICNKYKHKINLFNNNQKKMLSTNWLRYTMFIYQTKLDTMKFLSIFNRMKYFLYSLEIKTGCRIQLSKYLFMYKGNLIRLFVIDGPNKQKIFQCYTSLPDLFKRLLILDCERPS
ncbi:hypothetical protein MN116_004323 [Schistosoma mekongi]|uniref:Uncharacterized protein n=1 Tax=Schistosoma mekongi TaxID=38744 RepID=A0AAE2D7N7_SCHME|nr:hypothetical protein MN116_004323 [Schistosoma mekongi]